MRNADLGSRVGWTALLMICPLGVTCCHGGEVIFGSGAGTALAGQGGVAGSGTASAGPILPCTVVTSAEVAYWNTQVPCAEVTSGTADVTVNESATAQLWEGFGGAFCERGWNSLKSNGLIDVALPLLFGEDGCRFTFGRIPIGANDFAMDRYTLDEYSGDFAMDHFSIGRDRETIIPYIKAALAHNPHIRFWASPWTPPTWMKTDLPSPSKGSPYDGGTMNDDDAVLAAYARYLVRFVSSYAEQGISIEALAPQNEPSYQQSYPSCRWPVALYTKFIGEYLGPSLAAATASTRVILGTLSKADDDPAYLISVMADTKARNYIDVVGLQWDMLTVAATIREQSPDVPIWQTEHKGGNYPWNSPGEPRYQRTAPNDHAYAVESWLQIHDWISAGVTAYNAWNMVLDDIGQSLDSSKPWAQNALLVVNGGGQLIQTPAYYVFRHLSQFVVPGARVLGSSGGDALAFRNPDGSFVTVIYNSGAARQFVLAVGGKQFAFDMPNDGWATVQYRP